MLIQHNYRPRSVRLAQSLILLTLTGAIAEAAVAGDGGGSSSKLMQAGLDTEDPVVCYHLVQDAGRMIAWARWEKGYSLEKTRSAPFPPDTPAWMTRRVQDWITDAYHWQATDEQILQWASELGNVEDLPRADQLSRHETIAIWLRRIAGSCTAPGG